MLEQVFGDLVKIGDSGERGDLVRYVGLRE